MNKRKGEEIKKKRESQDDLEGGVMEVERSGEFAVHSEKEIIRTQTSETGRIKNKVQEKEEERVGGKKS